LRVKYRWPGRGRPRVRDLAFSHTWKKSFSEARAIRGGQLADVSTRPRPAACRVGDGGGRQRGRPAAVGPAGAAGSGCARAIARRPGRTARARRRSTFSRLHVSSGARQADPLDRRGLRPSPCRR
jgi:hypothetical protein